MDSSRFDALVRAASRSGSRRGLLGGLAALALAPLTVQAQPQPAACLGNAKRCFQPAGAGHTKGQRKGKRKPPSCAKCCSGLGITGSDGKAYCACKGEGVQCTNAGQCCGGQCRNNACTGCPTGTDFCTDTCADVQSNNQHCGSCANACAAGQRCVNGSCVCDGQSCPNGCCAGTTCKRGTSTSACGNGGVPCALCQTGDICTDGGCACVSGVICTGSGCCSSADQVCDQNDQCCTPDCTGKVCGDPDGCGGKCLGTCPSGQACSGGVCGTPPTCPGFRSPCVNGSQCCSGICGIDTCNCTRSGRTCHDTSDCCQNPPMTCIGFVCQ